MKVNVYLKNVSPSGGGGISPHILAVAEGFRRHGIEPNMLPVGKPEPCDLAVCWGVRKRAEMRSGRRALIVERGYVGDRFQWTSMGFDGLNGKADFCNRDMPGDRWSRYFASAMQPWRDHAGDYVLVLGQVPGDASIHGIVDIGRWYETVAVQLFRAGHKARFRAHPLAPKFGRHPTLKPIGGTLQEAFAKAKWVVSYNSNSALDAVLAGVPAVTIDRGAMAWDVTGHKATVAPPTPDRTQWANNLAYTQWSPDEIERGDAWDHLKVGMMQDAIA